MLNQLKIFNIKRILTRLLADQKATKQELVQKTGLSNTTVSDSINSMLRLGLVLAEGSEASIGGRRSATYTMNRDYGQFIGLELHQKYAVFAVTDPQGALLAHRRLECEAEELPIHFIYRALETACALPIAPKPLALGVGLQGAIDYDEQIVLESKALGWQNVHLKEIIERRLYIPTFIDHGANGQIPLEWFASEPGCPNNLMVFCEAFPRKAGVCMAGEILRGQRNLCGSVDSFEAAMDNTPAMARCWDMARLVLKTCSPGMTERAAALQQANPQLVRALPLQEEDPARGMALLAETLWFESIYFMLQ